MPKVDINKKRGYDAIVPIERIWSEIENGIIDGRLCVPLGENNSGKGEYIKLGKDLHILAAGEMLSGVGMFRRVALATLLKFNKPEALKFILIDPLYISFVGFKNIDDYLLFPIITQSNEGVKSLEWLNSEIDARMVLLNGKKYRYIEEYNEANPKDKRPKIVVMITEIGELIDFDDKTTNRLITRILQMSKCVGVHLIINTQRASSSVTGLIKAHTTAKIAFKAGDETESIAILSKSGAEELLGQGDMLVESNQWTKAQRLQGYHLSDGDIESEF